MSEWKRDGVWGVGRSYPNERPLPSHQPSDPRMLRDQARRTKEPSVPFVAAREAHGKRNYVAVFAFETSAFAGACS